MGVTSGKFKIKKLEYMSKLELCFIRFIYMNFFKEFSAC